MAEELFNQGSHALKEWLDCATAFCELVKTLDREGVNQAAWNGHKVPDADGLHWDGKTYLRAAGVTADRFSRAAEAFVQAQSSESKLLQSLKFTVEAGEPVVQCRLAIMRIQSLAKDERKLSASTTFVPLGLRQRQCEPLLFGSEARIELLTKRSDFGDNQQHHQMTPSVYLAYEVTGQQALKVFASVLQKGAVQPLWKVVGGFVVETDILLTKDHSQESIEDEWATSDDPDGKRLLKFCRKASRLSDEETCDWPPYLRLSCTLDSTSTDDDLERYFMAICAHTVCIMGDSGGWNEILGDSQG